MQKLKERHINIPTDTSLIRSNCGLLLNSPLGVMDSVTDLKTSFNNPEENLRLPVGGPKAITLAYVLNKSGSPLMPCAPTKARHLLRANKARVIRCNPFTIQLNWDCEENTQPIILGIDPGYENIGFSAVSGSKELISGEVKLRKNVSKKLTERRMYRRNRRNRLWHREPRFLNRGKKGWLAPSIQHKLDSHIRLVELITKRLLPVSKVKVEVANFDIEKIKDPSIEGKGYQEGEQLGFYNIREYVLHRDGHKCQHCKGKSKDKVLQVHHIRGKKEGATNRPEELMTVCKTCHINHHKGIDLIPVKEIKTFKPETFMSTVRWQLVDMLRAEHTYGYITKHNRIELGLEKSHSTDAFVIAGGNGQLRSSRYDVNQMRRNNRGIQLNRKGFAPAVRRQKYAYQPHDLVRWKNQIVGVRGVHSLGTRVVLENKKSVKIDAVELYKYIKGWQFLPAVNDGISLP